MKTCSKQPRTILITGCSSGIGHDAVITLAARGHRVIATCRKEHDVQALASLGYEALQLDVNDSNSIRTAFKRVLEKTNGQLDVLINNAGYGQVGALEDIPREVLREQFETNVFGLMELSSLAIPVMRRQGHGRIINLSSVLGLISMPFRGAYNASKYAVEGLCDTLRLELHASGIHVICIEPGPIESHFRDNAVDFSLKKIDTEHSHFQTQYTRMTYDYRQRKSDSIWTKQPDVISRKLVHAIESSKPKIKYPATLPTYLFIGIKRLLPTCLLDKLLIFLSQKELGVQQGSPKES